MTDPKLLRRIEWRLRVQELLPIGGLLLFLAVIGFAVTWRFESVKSLPSTVLQRVLVPGIVVTGRTTGLSSRDNSILEFRLQTPAGEGWIGSATGMIATEERLAPTKVRLFDGNSISVDLPPGFNALRSLVTAKIGGENWTIRYRTSQ